MATVRIPGCKLPRALENPLDDLLMVAVEPLLAALYGMGVTPNMVTLASAAAALASVYCCFAGRPLPAACLWVLGYVLDIVDGFLARRYKMESRLGDRLDHATDLLAYAGLVSFVAYRVFQANPRVLWPVAVEVWLACAAYYHMQCQERASHHMAIQGLDGCACRDEAHLAWTRYLGTGTLTAWHVFLILFYRRA
ncbi:hypothetical protein WJX74_001454 [Apatococcus lobatus]|uniref:CDP-alcohol phosphatidyltransferase family protein n=1 Tax=Apatococcus lobatus TaxID=904363 RepID=A0AAW1QZB4_9CHLO